MLSKKTSGKNRPQTPSFRTDKFIIEGGKPLKGEIEIMGSKNAALPILAATLLTKEPCEIGRIPRIQDIFRMLEILKGMGAKIKWLDEHRIRINNRHIDPTHIDELAVSRIRASVLLFGPLLARFRHLKLVEPGGCQIGARPLDTHFDALRSLGAKVSVTSANIDKNGQTTRDTYYIRGEQLKPARVTLEEFSVTATENLLLLAAGLEGTTTIHIAAAEPHVQDLCRVLTKMGAEIKGIGTHNLQIKGAKKLRGFKHELTPDYLEAGTFLVMGIATKSRIKIKGVLSDHLRLPLLKLKKMGAHIEINTQETLDAIAIQPSHRLQAIKIDARIYPGFPTDLQAPFGVLATQAIGTTLIHDTLFEGRLRYVEELRKMGANAIIADPHRALITGPTTLFGREIEGFDIRAGITMIVAALVAQGKSVIYNAYQVDRGYERIEERLQALGARIERTSS